MRRLPPFSALRAFEAAARVGSFAAASAELHQTPSAVSHQVRALETWFERRLFVRSARRVALTDDGRRLLNEISAAFDQIEDACAALRPADTRSSLAVHCAPSFAAKWLGPRLARFMQAHQGVTIRLSSSAEPVDLLGDEVEIDITYGTPPSRQGIVVESLGVERIVPLAAPRLFDGAPPRRPRDLAGRVWIDSKLNPVQWADWCRLNAVKLPPAARPSFDRGSLAVAAAADGLGIALETTRFAESELARGALVALDGPGFRQVERANHCLCYRKSNAARPAVLAFRQWLFAELARPVSGG